MNSFHKPEPEPPKPITLAKLMSLEFPKDQWLIESLIPQSGITILSGAPASFKTWMYQSAAEAIASGKPLFGEFPTKSTGVLIVDEENGEYELQRRFKVLGTDPDLPIQILTRTGFKVTNDGVTRLLVDCVADQIGLVIFDSLVRVNAGGDENDALKMASVFQQLQRFAREGIAVLAIHHHRKPGVNRGLAAYEMRGSSDILAAVDCHLAVERDPDTDLLTISQSKLRIGRQLKPFTVRPEGEESLTLSYAGEATQSQSKNAEASEVILDVLENTDQPLSFEEIHQRMKDDGVDVGARTVRQVLRKLVADGEITERRVEHGRRMYANPPEAVSPELLADL